MVSRVSIGLPVYNGAEYMAEALDGILAQSFSDFELIISDNASTDATVDICADYARRDSRIRLHRQSSNLGAAPNYNFVFEQSQGEYFKWAAHDDRFSPDFIERCVEVLDQDPTCVLCQARTQLIDAKGAVIARYNDRLVGNADEPAQRFGEIVLIDHPCYEIFGLMRTDALRRTRLHGSYIASDRVLLAELGIQGRFHELPEYLFYSRDHSDRSIRAIPFHFRSAWFDTANRGRIYLPHFKILWEYARAVRRLRTGDGNTMRCFLHLAHWPWVNANWLRLSADLVAAVAPGTVPAMLRLSRRLGITKESPSGKYIMVPQQSDGDKPPLGSTGE